MGETARGKLQFREKILCIFNAFHRCARARASTRSTKFTYRDEVSFVQSSIFERHTVIYHYARR
jgi:hypothetical protein